MYNNINFLLTASFAIACLRFVRRRVVHTTPIERSYFFYIFLQLTGLFTASLFGRCTLFVESWIINTSLHHDLNITIDSYRHSERDEAIYVHITKVFSQIISFLYYCNYVIDMYINYIIRLTIHFSIAYIVGMREEGRTVNR